WKNFIDLVTSDFLSSSLQISAEHIWAYNICLMWYLQHLKDLYKEAVLKPNHHFVLYVSVYLHAFGPGHLIRAFFAEKMNYLLMKLNNNRMFGAL
ncbi:uncharacterized protein LAESUDRAFT_637060, partial [Laetiporus sulphureus 93-53]